MPTFLANINLSKNQMLNMAIQNLATAPSNPVPGQIYFNTTDSTMYYYSGITWIVMDAQDFVGHVHGNATSSSNGFMSSTDKNKLDGVNAGANKVEVSSVLGSIKINGVDTKILTASDVPGNAGKIPRLQADGTLSWTPDSDTVTTVKGTGGTAASGEITIQGTGLISTSQSGNVITISTTAQQNAVTSVAGKTGAVSLVAGDVGLGNVTNNAQMKKIASSTNGNIPTWSGATGDTLGAGYAVESSLAGSASAIPLASAVKTYVDSLLGANDAMIFKGTLGTGGTITALPTTYNAGWAYKVITAGTYAGNSCEVGDLIIATVDRSGSGNTNADWAVVQTNLDGAVTSSSASVTSGNFAVFDGSTGKVIKESSFSSQIFTTFAPIDHTHTGTYTRKYAVDLSAATSQVITHNLGTTDVCVTVKETASPFAMVMPDIEFTSVNTLTVKFATAPTAGQYRIVVVG